MSLVGTRPPTVDEWEQYELHHRSRMSTKPGITGMWQVSGRSDITDFEEVVRLDTEYIEKWNIGLDKHTFIFLFDKGVIFDEMKSQGLDVIDLSMLRIMPRMRKLLSISYQYDIIVLHHGSMGMNFFYDFLMFFNHKSRFVLMEHDCFEKSTYYTYNSKWKNFLRKCLLENSMKYSDRIVYARCL